MLPIKNQESGPIECRICHSRTTRDLILSPCLCKGSMAYVHYLCLERWLNYSSRDKCELCSYQFNVVQNRRYTCLQSVRVWFRHPANRTFIMCDLVIGFILTALTFALICTCILGLNHFVKEGNSKGVPTFWSQGIVDLFLIILFAGYLATIYSMAKDHVRPWYTWWIRCNNVSLVLDKNPVNILPMPANVAVKYENYGLNNTNTQLSKVIIYPESNIDLHNSGKEIETINIHEVKDTTNDSHLSSCETPPITTLNFCNEFTPSTSKEEMKPKGSIHL